MTGGFVVEMPNERFVLSRGGISFTAKSGRFASHCREWRLPLSRAHRCSQLALLSSARCAQPQIQRNRPAAALSLARRLPGAEIRAACPECGPVPHSPSHIAAHVPPTSPQADRASGGGLFGGGRANVDAFDIPLATLTNESFNQPIFGANNLTGTSPPLPESVCDQDIHWNFTFKSGGVGTFLPIFFGLLREMRRHISAERRGESSGSTQVAFAVPAVVVAEIVNAAYVDPSDPTKLYVQQQDPPSAPVMGKPVS